jgi:hypothetical protein
MRPGPSFLIKGGPELPFEPKTLEGRIFILLQSPALSFPTSDQLHKKAA